MTQEKFTAPEPSLPGKEDTNRQPRALHGHPPPLRGDKGARLGGGTRELTSAGDLTWVRKRQDFLGHDPVTGDLHGQVGPPMKHAVTEDAEGCVVLSDLQRAP